LILKVLKDSENSDVAEFKAKIFGVPYNAETLQTIEDTTNEIKEDTVRMVISQLQLCEVVLSAFFHS
jgi:hypothetical protein